MYDDESYNMTSKIGQNNVFSCSFLMFVLVIFSNWNLSYFYGILTPQTPRFSLTPIAHRNHCKCILELLDFALCPEGRCQNRSWGWCVQSRLGVRLLYCQRLCSTKVTRIFIGSNVDCGVSGVNRSLMSDFPGGRCFVLFSFINYGQCIRH